MCGILCLIYCNRKVDLNQSLTCLQQLSQRGPDAVNYKIIESHDKEIFLGFTRLSIMDLDKSAMQPFSENGNYIVCNGEIYDYQKILDTYKIKLNTTCDCEVLLPLYEKCENIQDFILKLDAEFAFILYDKTKNTFYATRDRYGVRPLFYGFNAKLRIYGFASEMKALISLMDNITPIQPNLIYSISLDKDNEDILQCRSYFKYEFDKMIISNLDLLKDTIRYTLICAVSKRLQSDRPIGLLLSGGLDSSLIVAIATKILNPTNIECFSIGLPMSSDIIASKKVCEFLQIKKHHIIDFNIDKALNTIPEVIKMTETYDITTIRASTPQYIMAKYISTQTNIKVLLSGEGSDEIHGSYKYFRNAPSSTAFHQETIRLLRELYMYDNLRTDRTMASFGLEVRVPFLDFAYVDLIMKIDPNLLMYKNNRIEKQLIRDAFKGYLPDEILYRPKEAFSDAVSDKDTTWYKTIEKMVEIKFNDDDLKNSKYTINKPETKEALYYRDIFNSYYKNQDRVISHYWLPLWNGKITNPSATILEC